MIGGLNIEDEYPSGMMMAAESHECTCGLCQAYRDPEFVAMCQQHDEQMDELNRALSAGQVMSIQCKSPEEAEGLLRSFEGFMSIQRIEWNRVRRDEMAFVWMNRLQGRFKGRQMVRRMKRNFIVLNGMNSL